MAPSQIAIIGDNERAQVIANGTLETGTRMKELLLYEL